MTIFIVQFYSYRNRYIFIGTCMYIYTYTYIYTHMCMYYLIFYFVFHSVHKNCLRHTVSQLKELYVSLEFNKFEFPFSPFLVVGY